MSAAKSRWKAKYGKARQKRCAEDPEYRAKRIAQGYSRTPAENAVYMREYYKKNKHRWASTPAKKKRKNDARRERYRSDEAYRERHKQSVKEHRRKHPIKHRSAKLSRAFGITTEDYRALLRSQGGGCAICGRKASKTRDHRNGKPRRLSVDHCHATGRVRGVLCSSCNFGLGLFADDVERLRSAVAYLAKYGRAK